MQEQQQAARLVWGNGEGTKEEWSLSGTVTSIGRRDDNDIVVRERSVSRYHARITFTGERHIVQDLRSTNGLLLNGQRILEPWILCSGDELQLAPTVRLRFVDDGTLEPASVKTAEASLAIGPETSQVRVRGTLLTPPLSPAQFRLLALLAQQAGRVYCRDEIIAAVWPGDEAAGVSDAAINALVRRARLRLREADTDQEYIVTVRGHGLKLDGSEGL